ncbi:acyltransferase family protein [Bacteroides fragilis]
MELDDDLRQLKVISVIRFPLIIGVVFIHAHFTEVDGISIYQTSLYPSYTFVSMLLSDVLARIAVPFFFFHFRFSFFFYKTNFSFNVFKSKLSKRIKTLLVPYLFWNLIVLLFYFFCQYFFSLYISNTTKMISDFSWIDFLASFWNIHKDSNSEYPICFQLWFIRDLIVTIIFTPLIYFFVKYIFKIGIVLIGLCWFFDYKIPICGLNIAAMFFFSLGAYFSIHKQSFVKVVESRFIGLSLLYLFLICLAIYLGQTTYYGYVQRLTILVGIFFSSYSFGKIVTGNEKTNRKFFCRGRFFLFMLFMLFLYLLQLSIF